MCLSIHANEHASNSGGRTPESKLPASPPPVPRPDGGTGPYQQLKASFMPHDAINSRHWNSLDLHNRGIDHHVNSDRGISTVCKPWGTTLRLDRGEDDLVDERQLRRLGRTCTTCIRGTSITRKRTATGETPWAANSLDHGNLPLRYERNVEDHK